MYEKVNANRNFVQQEKKIEQFWKDNRIFEKSIEDRKDSPVYMFYDGPPTANGKPHIGHVLTRVIKDMIPRYHTMKGERVPRKAGWDTHGLPVELEVEKLLGFEGKENIEKYGIAPFIDKCKESVWKYKGMWEDFSSTVGFWADMEHPYVTYENDYIESIWWSLKKIWERGLLYKGYRIVPYCPRCGTPLASHEVAQGYKDVTERSAVVRFKCKDDDAYFLAWTTTPWTLPSNVALCVHPELDYVKVKAADGYTYWLAEGQLESVLKEGWTVLERVKGRELERREYEPLYSFQKVDRKGHYVTLADYVTLGEGTGIVHIAPAFGEDDYQVGLKYDLPFLQYVDSKGDMTEPTPWAGTFVKQADPLILQDLEDRQLLFSAPKFTHSYPHCWRCGTPLIYYARESWYIKMTEVRDDLLRNNATINWIPATIGEKRFGNWLENIQDWAISRNRYWGTPLPIWECECGHKHCVGSIEELKSMSDNCPDDIELHRPYVDEVTIKCPVCGKPMHRVEEVIDCWYDSGAMPFAQYHYPFENKETFESTFPADFISEAVDQTRGWFYSLLAISTLLFNKAPYKNVIVLGLVLDENGEKMSKSKGNAVDPFEALEAYGADSIRWYFYENSAPWLPNRFYKEAVTEGQRKFLGTFWNTYAFYVLYADIDSFDPTKYTLDRSTLNSMDRWLLSRLNSLIKEVDADLGGYKIPEAARALQDFTDELSNWYVRRSRERFWESEMTQSKINAYLTLWTALVTLSKLAAPMIPFMTEEIYQNIVRRVDLTAPESIHLCDFPVADESLIDEELEHHMEEVLKIVVLGRAARNEANVKNRQPLSVMYVGGAEAMGDLYKDIIEDELNVKNVIFTDDMSRFSSYTFKPQLRTLGRRFGKRLNEVREILANLDGSAAKKELDETGQLVIHTADGDETLAPEDLLIEASRVEGFASASEGGYTVALDTDLTEDLIKEGYVREVVSKIQSMRKEADFNVMDHIKVCVKTSDRLADVVREFSSEISEDVLADAILFGEGTGFTREWDINGENAVISVERV
ncbi:MAG: isoleucine--tRNA ligase [Eubacterium sp.]|nr:isoleucine--tRNA ligase [Eubacterium sp.]MBQ3412142.1 isoleucine--tRNA ligase [Oscillospiraceae bacterium]